VISWTLLDKDMMIPQTKGITHHPAAPGRIFLRQRFTDLEELVLTTKEWDLSFMQLGSEQFQGELMQAIAPDWQLSHARFGSALKQEGLPPAHLRNIVIPATPAQEFSWRGQRIAGNSVMLFPLGAELECVSENSFEVYIIAVQEDRLDQACRASGLKDLYALTGGAEVIECESQAVHRLRQVMRTLTCNIKRTPDVIHQASFSQAITSDLCVQVLSALGQGQAAGGTNLPRRQDDMAKRAVAYIKTHAPEGLTIYELCRQLNLSERSLRAAFHSCYAMSPKAFLKRYQLTQVRRRLYQASSTSTRVREVANAWGFWHMGQFARDYEAMFGELPSYTLCRKCLPKQRNA
jgi:AraC family ethanolamine operon transcriptional activator